MRRRERAKPARNPTGSIIPSDTRPLLRASAAARGVALDDRMIQRLDAFLAVLLEWRESTPLVAQRDAAAVIAKHVEDAFAAAALVRGPARVADLGTGAGFPGMVIAIACPEAEVLLVESKRRKASFLRAAIRRTGIVNARVIEARAEDLAGEVEGLDLVVSRAVWPGGTFFELARPLLRRGGMAVAMKTPESGEVALPSGYAPPHLAEYALSAGEKRALLQAEAL